MRMRMRRRFGCLSHIRRRPQYRAGQRVPLLNRARVALMCGPGTSQPAAFDDLGMLPRTIANVLPLVLVLVLVLVVMFVMVMLRLLGHRSPPSIQVGMVWKIGKGNEFRRGESFRVDEFRTAVNRFVLELITGELLLRSVVNACNFCASTD
jgi:hypothetical protein